MVTYKAEVKQDLKLWKKDNFMTKEGLFTLGLAQSYEKLNVEYVILSFDATVAFLGGYTALVW